MLTAALMYLAILQQIGRLTAGNGTVASFTAAAAVRDGLSKAGFHIKKRRGYGRKRDMIVGHKVSHAGGEGNTRLPVARVGVIGGGIAGASVAAGLVRRGTEVTILEAGPGLANGASGNRLALQSPRLAVDHNLASRLSAACLAFAATLSDRLSASVAAPVLALDSPVRQAERHAKFRRQLHRTGWGLGVPNPMRSISTNAIQNMGERLNERYKRRQRMRVARREIRQTCTFTTGNLGRFTGEYHRSLGEIGI